MNPSSRKYKKEYAYELIKIAEGDLASANALSSASVGRPENVIYIAQQAIGKALKAVLCFREKPIVHTHDLEVLVTLLEKDIPPDAHQLGILSQYATIRRYEEGYEELTADDFKLVLETGNRVLKWAKSIVKSSP